MNPQNQEKIRMRSEVKKKTSNEINAEIQLDAYILDAQAHSEGIRLWLKTSEGSTIEAIYPFHPSFYLVMHYSMKKSMRDTTPEAYFSHLAEQMQNLEYVKNAKLCYRRVHAEDIDPHPTLEITVSSPFRFKKTVQKLREMRQFEFYNTDIPFAQMFFYQTGLFPFAFCQVHLKKKQEHWYIHQITLQDSNEEPEYNLPLLRIVWLDLIGDTYDFVIRSTTPLRSALITIDPLSSPISLSAMFPPEQLERDSHDAPQVVLDLNDEESTLIALEQAIKRLDPDIIFTHKGDDDLFPYLLARLRVHHLNHKFSLSRDGVPLAKTVFETDGADAFQSYGQFYHRARSQFYLNGRLHINSAIMGSLHFDDGNLYGIVEIARISYITLQRLTRVTIGGALQSMQYYHAFKQRVLIPEEKKNSEEFRAASNLLLSDRGGYILNPRVGMYHRVAELDFTSMYPSLMVEYNISPETLNCSCCKQTGRKVPGLPYYTCLKREGIVPLSLRLPLQKRIYYKTKIKQSTEHTAQRYEQMQQALKWILVVCFGYLGFRNARFGRIEAHQAVCAYSREFLLNATEIIESHGLEYLHGIVDSIYVQSPAYLTDEEFHTHCQQIVHEIEQKTHIPISYDPDSDFFSAITFLPTKAQPEIGALNRYWGIKPNGGLKVRGLELRRHDAPLFVKAFEEHLLRAITQFSHPENFPRLFQEIIMPLFTQYVDKLRNNHLSAEDLAITIRLTRQPDQYKVSNYQAIAAHQLQKHGLPLGPGQKISFIIVNDRAKNRDERVLPLQIYQQSGQKYDILKYTDLLIRVIQNVLPFALSKEYMHLLTQILFETSDTMHQTQRTLQDYLSV